MRVRSPCVPSAERQSGTGREAERQSGRAAVGCGLCKQRLGRCVCVTSNAMSIGMRTYTVRRTCEQEGVDRRVWT
jgi:hypothetical protein